MREITWLTLAIAALLSAGYRTAARVTEAPRVDLELTGGNRGYLVGTPPEPAQRDTTRQMVQTDVEIPSFYKPKPTGTKVSLEEIAPTDAGAQSAHAGGVVALVRTPAGPHDTYVVQKGDSLWSIAAKPEIYGKASRWRQIFDANRDILKSPDSLHAGMKLRIPRGRDGGSTTYGEEGVTFKK